MMFRSLFRKRRFLSGAAAAILAASAYQAGGCTINVDENLLQQLQGFVDGMDDSGGSHPGSYRRPPMGTPPGDSGNCDGDSSHQEHKQS